LKVQEGSGRVRHQWLLSPSPPPFTKKILPDFYVSHGPHLAAPGGSGPLDPPASYAADYATVSSVKIAVFINVYAITRGRRALSRTTDHKLYNMQSNQAIQSMK